MEKLKSHEKYLPESKLKETGKGRVRVSGFYMIDPLLVEIGSLIR